MKEQPNLYDPDTTFQLFLKDLFSEYYQDFDSFSFCFENNKIMAISFEGEKNTLYFHNSGIFLVSNHIDTLHYTLNESFIDLNIRVNFKNYLINNGADQTESFNIVKSSEVGELIEKYKVNKILHEYNKKFEEPILFLKSFLNDNLLSRTEDLSIVKTISYFLTYHHSSKNDQKFKFTDNDKIIEFLEIKHIESDLDFDNLINFFKVKKNQTLNNLVLK